MKRTHLDDDGLREILLGDSGRASAAIALHRFCEVTRYEVLRLYFTKLGDLTAKPRFLVSCPAGMDLGAPRMEATTRGDVGCIWWLARQDLAGRSSSADLRNYREKSPRIGVLGVHQNLLGSPHLHDLSEVHDCHPIGDRPRKAEIVRDEDQG